jgi:glycosyltransferase involved in cell wall biosynthesis
LKNEWRHIGVFNRPQLQIPRVSICIPAYNHARFLGRALESALAQTETDVEVIVIDDCSTDDTLAIAAAYGDPRLRVEKNERRLGELGNVHRFFKIARGKYIKFLHDDDVLYPEAVGRLADALDRFPEATFATSAWNCIDVAGRYLRTVRLLNEAPAEGALIGLRQITRLTWLGQNRIGNPSAVLLRQDALGYRARADYQQVGDWELWLRLVRLGPLVYLPQVLSGNRSHADTQTARQRHVALTSIELLALSREWQSSPSDVRGEVSRFDLKRLQLLCIASALKHALLSLFRADGASLFENLRIVAQSLGVFTGAKRKAV